ncbi:helix-turn-helix transcriptional regulator [Jannaschia sp. M317]|uniref:helix-turn-helix transcriptional regulator n=1 Tax=Jannaschia sp. M317 TaxID=2867011 RepID=UPI0021A91E4B|nr:helix-turn-helix transcriptional regulator [Jannaschia sp. M317]UWQ16628.1 helix-turn-helix transcriptional regulator [Jannaschia sp. M317]
MTFGSELRRWRAHRRLSQLDLALEAQVSPRHLSFLETGRAQPSRTMVARLGRALDVPLGGLNVLMTAAGFAPAHRRSDLSEAHMARVGAAMARIVDRHDPWPGFVLDADWRLVRVNACAGRLFAPLGLGVGDSLLAAFTTPGFGAEVIENWPEVARHFATRLSTESRAAGGNALLDQATRVLLSDPQVGADTPETDAPILPTIYRFGGLRLAFFSTFVTFQGARDVSLADLKVELLFPADAATEAALT